LVNETVVADPFEAVSVPVVIAAPPVTPFQKVPVSGAAPCPEYVALTGPKKLLLKSKLMVTFDAPAIELKSANAARRICNWCLITFFIWHVSIDFCRIQEAASS